MTKQCAACSRFMQVKGAAVCKTCSNIYHKACLMMPEAAKVATDWICPECKKKLPRGDNTATPVKGVSCSFSDPVTYEDGSRGGSKEGEPDLQSQLEVMTIKLRETIQTEIRLAREEMVSEFKRELSDVRAALETSNKRVECLEKRLEALENVPRPTEAQSDQGQLNAKIKELKMDLNDRDQELLAADLEIANFPEIPGENVLHTVGIIANKIGVSLDQRDLVFAERVGYHKGGNAAIAQRPRRIVVRLARCCLRDDMLQAARVRRGVDTSDMDLNLPVKKVFVNERLTRHNRQVEEIN